MAKLGTDPKAYDKARAITEKALEAYARNDTKTGDKLIDEATRLDKTAVKNVYEMLEEDAGSEHDWAKLNKSLSASAQH